MSTFTDLAVFSSLTKSNVKDKTQKNAGKKRKTLQTIQPEARRKNILVGKDGSVNTTSLKKAKRKREGHLDDEKAPKSPKLITSLHRWVTPVKIYEDTKSQSEDKEKKVAPSGTETPAEQKTSEAQISDKEAHELLVQEDVPETYWKEVAEERRVALADALDENEKLHGEIKELKKENEQLSSLASQAEYFAGIVKLLTDDDANDEKGLQSSDSDNEKKKNEGEDENSGMNSGQISDETEKDTESNSLEREEESSSENPQSSDEEKENSESDPLTE